MAWIPIGICLPEEGSTVLLCSKSKRRHIGFYYYDELSPVWQNQECNTLTDITHWSPLDLVPPADTDTPDPAGHRWAVFSSLIVAELTKQPLNKQQIAMGKALSNLIAPITEEALNSIIDEALNESKF